jgi:excisionase family DNA binding protein
MNHAAKTDDPFIPNDHDARMAGEASRVLAAYVSTRRELELHIDLKDETGRAEHMVLPPSVARMMQRILTEMAQGNAITIIPMNAELTTQEAADFLNVSRPFIVKQLDMGNIPFRKIGTHRRIQVQDLMNYKRDIDKARHQTLDELASEAQKLGLGY